MKTPAKDLAHYLGIKYPISVQEGPEGGYFVTHPDLDGCMAEGKTIEEAIENLTDSRELWIESRLEGGYPVPEPAEEETCSGRISLRMAPALHASLARIAQRRDISLNLLINTVLASYAGGEDALQPTLQELRETLEQLKTVQAQPAPAAGIKESARLRPVEGRRSRM
jgi:antitoxin HicB